MRLVNNIHIIISSILLIIGIYLLFWKDNIFYFTVLVGLGTITQGIAMYKKQKSKEKDKG